MRVLAIADRLIGPQMLAAGLAETPELSADLTIREWVHGDLSALQEDNLIVEQRGPDAVAVPSALFEDVDSFDVVITHFCPIGSEVVARASRVKAIGVMRAGTENVHPSAAAGGIPVVNAPGRNANAVAEFAVGMILAETRNIARSHAQVHRCDWDRSFANADAIPELASRHVGLVGLGQIGARVAQLLSAFDARISYFDPYITDAPYQRFDDLATLASEVDILSIHSRMTDATARMVSAEVISKMQPHAVLVNTARSGLVDEAALIQALADKRIMGAAIDTFDTEPLPADSPFLALDNVTITSHLAGSTIDAMSKTPRILAARLLATLGDATAG